MSGTEPSTAREATSALYESRKTDPAAAFENAMRWASRWPDDHNLQAAVGWCIYDRYVKGLAEKPSADALSEALQACHDLTDAYERAGRPPVHAAVSAILKVSKVLAGLARHADAVRLLSRLDPSALQSVGTKPYDSQRGQWAGQITKALAASKQWDDLRRVASAALEAGGLDSQREWVEYRLAMAFEEAGDAGVALQHLDKAFPRMHAPWMLLLRGRLLAALGRSDEALDAMRRGLASFPLANLHFAWKTLVALASVLAESDPDRARRHLDIAFGARAKEGWPANPIIAELGGRLGHTPSAAEASTIESEHRWWKEAEALRRVRGVVKDHLQGGGSGFIDGDDGERYYFSKRRDDTTPLFPVGTVVTFDPAERMDPKKGRMSKVAQRVRRA